MDLLEILVTHVQHRFAQANGGSANITRVHAFHAFHALLLPFILEVELIIVS